MSPGVLRNAVTIAGSLMERDALRMTPARVPVVGFKIRHESLQMELDVERNVTCELSALAIGPLAQQIAAMPMGVEMRLEGFLAARSARHQNPVLHVTKFELLESAK
ncbi:MAG: prepilin peptidase [Rhodocyclales bacterium]|nr:prepilin peptidase [Rhodocyclales bacterium]